MQEAPLTSPPPSTRRPRRWKRLAFTLLLLLAAVWVGRLYLVRQMILPRRVISFPDQVVSLALSPDGSLVAVGTKADSPQAKRQPLFTGEVSLWDAQTGALRRRLMTGEGVSAVAFSPDGRTLATVSGRTLDSALRLWDVKTGRLLRTLSPVNSFSLSIAFSPDSRTVVVDDDKKVRAWDVGTGTLRRTFVTQGPVCGIAVSRFGSLLACVSYVTNKKGPPGSGVINIYDLRTGQRLRSLPIKSSEATLAFSPDGRWLATAGHLGGWTSDWGPAHVSANGEALSDEFNLFDVKTGARRWTQWSDQGAQSVVFTPDSRCIATGNLAIELRDAQTGALLRTLKPPWQSAGNWISASCLALSPDGATLASRGENTVNLWDLNTVNLWDLRGRP